MSVVRNFLSGSGLAARLMRSSTWVIAGHLLSQIIRFGSNLILTRLLFPEVFGLMALITVFIAGATPDFNHHTEGYPDFTDWPNSWNSATHQYSLREARPVKTENFLKKRRTAWPNDAP